MEINNFVSDYVVARDSFYRWQHSTSVAYRLMLAFGFACLTGASAFLKIYTPFTPVPFTAQVFVVLMSGLVLGAAYGGMSQAIYLALGVIGVPWFAGGNAGLEYAFGATGGYLVGFVIAALLVGYIADRHIAVRGIKGLVPLMLLGVAVIYAIGVTWLAIVASLTPYEALMYGAVPFIALDLVKAVLAAGAGRAVASRVAF